MRTLILIAFFCLIGTASFANTGKLSFIIDGFGTIDCNIEITLASDSASPISPIYILLPFIIDQERQIRIQDDLIYSSRSISKKYTLLNVLVPQGESKLFFSVQAINNSIPTNEGKPKISIDFNYSDLPKSLKDLFQNESLIHAFDISWTPPQNLEAEEVSFHPAKSIKRDSLNSFYVLYSDLNPKDRKTWLVYPNFKNKKDQEIQFYLLLLIGVLTGFAQLSPIIERKTKTMKYQAVVAALIVLTLSLLYFSIPKNSFTVIKSIAAPIIPHVLYIFGGLVYLRLTKNLLYKLSGVVRDEKNEPLIYADVELYLNEEQALSGGVKPFKKLYELNNGRFEFSFLDRKKKEYYLRISKKNRGHKVFHIPAMRDKSFELPSVVVLEKQPNTE